MTGKNDSHCLWKQSLGLKGRLRDLADSFPLPGGSLMYFPFLLLHLISISQAATLESRNPHQCISSGWCRAGLTWALGPYLLKGCTETWQGPWEVETNVLRSAAASGARPEALCAATASTLAASFEGLRRRAAKWLTWDWSPEVRLLSHPPPACTGNGDGLPAHELLCDKKKIWSKHYCLWESMRQYCLLIWKSSSW